MKIKVGEYVRTEKGLIRKVTKVINDVIEIDKEYYDEEDEYSDIRCYDFFYKNEIAKHSPKIIDLIEEGDYVNGKQVYSIGTAIGNFPIINYKDGTFDIDSNIKTIVTHEQFEETEYEV